MVGFVTFLALLTPLASGGSPKAPAVEVELKVDKRLRLVSWRPDKSLPPEAIMKGAVEVRVKNVGATPLKLQRLEVHGLIFEAVESGALHVIVHPCQCVRDASSDAPPALSLEPGQVDTQRFEDWGCSGMWDPPPPGRYRLSYRVLEAPREPPERAEPEKVHIKEALEACRVRFTTPDTWRQAATSTPIELTLKAPRGMKKKKKKKTKPTKTR